MKRYIHSSVTALAMTAMLLGAVVVTTVGLSAVPAFSKSDNANSNPNSGRGNNNRGGNSNNSGGNSNNSSGNNNDRGAAASSLGALNAAHANANAFANAAENSRVGMIELYKVAVMATAEAKNDLEWFKTNCENPEEESSIFKECNALMLAASENPDEPLEYRDYLDILYTEAVDLKNLEDKALELAANNRTDGEFIEALWSLLEIPGHDLTN